MKQLKQFFALTLVLIFLFGTLDADGKTRRKHSQKRQTTAAKSSTSGLSSQDVLDLFSVSFNIVSLNCPYECYDGVIAESVSFKNKCVEMVLAYSSDFMNENELSFDGVDLSFLCERAIMVMSNQMMQQLSVPLKTFEKTGIYYKVTIKDDNGKVLGTKTVTNKEIVKYCKENASNGTNDNFVDMKTFQQMINVVNSQTPIDTGYGIVINSIFMEGKTIYYDAVVTDTDISDVLAINPELMKDILKPAMAKSFYDSFKSSGILNNMVSMGISLNFRFYKENASDPILTIPVSAREIKRLGEES